MRRLDVILPLALLASLAACPDRTISKVPPTQQGATLKAIPTSADLDILFVIDNSASTADKQASFAANFPSFITALDAFPTGRPNMHIGVVSTSVSVGSSSFGANCANGDDGLLQNTARAGGCTAPTGRYIIDIASGSGGGAPVCGVNRTCNYPASESLGSAFVCIASLGTGGCGFEAQLEAMKRALDGSHPENAGFVRPGAYLAVVILTDEDDCSIADPSLMAMTVGTTAVNNSDFRCQPLYAYTCDTQISSAAGGTYTNCSATTPPNGYLHNVNDYYNFLVQGTATSPPIKNAQQTVVALIGGGEQPTANNTDPPPSGASIMTGMISSPFSQQLALLPSCMATVNGSANIARPAIRINEFVGLFGTHGIFRTICQSSYAQALKDIGDLLFAAISPCLEGAIATCGNGLNAMSPACTASNPPGGIALDCTVSDVQNAGTSMQMSTAIPPCNMTSPTMPAAGQTLCYWISKNPGVCSSATLEPSQLQINFVRTATPPVGTVTNVSCAVTSSM